MTDQTTPEPVGAFTAAMNRVAELAAERSAWTPELIDRAATALQATPRPVLDALVCRELGLLTTEIGLRDREVPGVTIQDLLAAMKERAAR